MIEKTYVLSNHLLAARNVLSVYEMKTGHFQLKSASGNKLMLLFFFFDYKPRFIRRNTPYTEEPFHDELPEGITKSVPLPPQSQVAKPRMQNGTHLECHTCCRSSWHAKSRRNPVYKRAIPFKTLWGPKERCWRWSLRDRTRMQGRGPPPLSVLTNCTKQLR